MIIKRVIVSLSKEQNGSEKRVMSSIIRKFPYRFYGSRHRVSLFRSAIHAFHAKITLRTPVYSCNIPESCTH